jgi:hypothetical protein
LISSRRASTIARRAHPCARCYFRALHGCRWRRCRPDDQGQKSLLPSLELCHSAELTADSEVAHTLATARAGS